MKETYGNVPTDSSDDTYASISTDSSDDQGWDSNTRKRSPKTLVLALPNYRTNDDMTNVKTKHSSKRGTRQKAAAVNMNKSVTKTPEDTGKASSSVRRTTPSSYRRLSQLALEVIFFPFPFTFFFFFFFFSFLFFFAALF